MTDGANRPSPEERAGAARQELARAADAEPKVDWQRVGDGLPWRLTHPPKPIRFPGGLVALLALAAVASGLVYLLWPARPPARDALTRKSDPGSAPARVPSALPPPAPASTSEAGGRSAFVTAVAGQARSDHGIPRGWAALELGERLGTGARLATGQGRASLQWGQGTGASLLPGTEIELRALDPSQSVLTLARGQLALRVSKRGPGEIFRIETPGHTLEVRGTWFLVGREAGRTTLSVYEGAVAVRALHGEAETVIRKGQAALFWDGQSEASPLPRAPRTEPWLVGWTERLAASRVRFAGAAADIVFDGALLGPVPAAAEVVPGRHRLELVRAGSREQRVMQVAGSEQLVKVAEPDLSSRAHQVGAHVGMHQDDVRGCYERGLKRDPLLAGAPKLRLRVAASGHVQRAELVKSDLGDADVEACILSVAQRWVFPAGEPITFDTTLDLRQRRWAEPPSKWPPVFR